jgi:hypothetical protein
LILIYIDFSDPFLTFVLRCHKVAKTTIKSFQTPPKSYPKIHNSVLIISLNRYEQNSTSKIAKDNPKIATKKTKQNQPKNSKKSLNFVAFFFFFETQSGRKMNYFEIIVLLSQNEVKGCR